MRGKIPWDEDLPVKESNKEGDAMNVVVCSFMPQSDSTIATLKTCPAGYRLHCGENRLQLYDRNIGNTFIFISRSGATSIALGKIPGTVQRVSCQSFC